jgi:hypothetical protein
MNQWECRCGWRGSSAEISVTDDSQERELEPGVVTVYRVHRALCPRCFAIIKRVQREEVPCS